ncbi:hypothetical protein [Photobacterium galatheae]|uniref:Uncharacterized protein n=1 Tax=Photobacterium galatheae TaxID=1654360 RepID=A0A066RMD9_9GAMM|nr:hypothetical protein [Photobacterium galatheae]KDM90266.1 hypothetical protein EA58_18305 [Photobacterium galatheae]MCM0151472.1 hypothetical protein [Photobacterium galatheae]
MQNDAIDNLLISISRLVAVDSAGVAIAEIDLREGGILIGGGNIGKTSILNAIRLFLLPEENFKSSAKKFGFSDKEGKFFSDDESFEHYFPSTSSFLILECDNYLGGRLPHCQILYRGSADKLDYRRMFTSLRYEQIRHLFWDASAGDDGIGGRVEGLSPTKVQTFLKREDKYFKPLMRSAAIKEVIYANQLLDTDAMRFCLFPLSTTDDANVDAFRALVRLLFDMKTGSDTVRLAVANIIESQKKERKDELNFDIDAFIEHNEALARRERLLKNIDSLRPEFDRLSASHQALMRNKNAEDALMQYAMMVQNRIEKACTDIGLEESQLKLMENRVSGLRKEWRETESSQKSLEGERKTLCRQQTKLDEVVQKTQLLVSQYDETDTLEMIIEGHREHLAEKQHELALKLDAEKRQEELLVLTQEISKLEASEQRYQASVESQEFKLFNQLTESVWLKLAALNSDVAEANPGRVLSPSESQVIEAFADLIQPDESGYELLGAKLEAVSLDKRESDQSRLDKVRAVLEGKRKRASEISAMDKESRFEQVKTITTLKTEISRTETEIDLLLACKSNTQQLHNLNEELEVVENKQLVLKRQFESQQEVFFQEQQAYSVQQEKVTEMKSQLEKLTQYQQSAKVQLEAHGLPTLNFSVMPDQSLPLTEDQLQTCIDNLQSKREARAEIAERIRDFVRNQVLENDDQLMRPFIEDELLSHAFEQLQSRYQGLEEEFDILRKNFVEHKHSIHSIINELKNNREIVRQFEQSINRAFANVRINDLVQVEAEIKVEARFNDLVGEIEHLDTHSDQKASEQFIERLKAFSQKFFPDGKTALLTMEQIVAGIAYRVKKQGQTGLESKSQSTSTIMLINLKLVEILLGRLRNKACTTHFPLIIDEGASVDSSQFDWLLPNLKQAGFRVLSASTNSASSEIIFKFGQHFRLDAMRTATPYHPARTIAFTGMPDSFVTKGSVLDREQLVMFGEADE